MKAHVAYSSVWRPGWYTVRGASNHSKPVGDKLIAYRWRVLRLRGGHCQEGTGEALSWSPCPVTPRSVSFQLRLLIYPF